MADLSVKPEPIFRAPIGRVVDVPGIGSMGTGPGGFAARITDPLCPWIERVWSFETVDGALQVGEAGAADCELIVHGLAALIYGTHDPADFFMPGWGDPAPGVQQTMRAMFPPRLPYLHAFF